MHCRNSMQAKKDQDEGSPNGCFSVYIGALVPFCCDQTSEMNKASEELFLGVSQIQRLSSIVRWLCYIRP